jgi:proline iminopeptidase
MMVVNRTKNNIPHVILLTSWLIFAIVMTTTTIHHGTIISITFCSAWIVHVQHPFRNHNHNHNHNQRHQQQRQRQRSRFYSTTTTTTETTATATATTTAATSKNEKGNISAVVEEYKQLYPQSTTRTNGTILTEDGIHTLYYEIYGTGSLNALFLHGGPGSGCFPNHARFFDPTKYRVVLLDQRGAGRSSPTGCVINNTLSHLVDDCELLRKHLLLQDQEEQQEEQEVSSSVSSSWDVILGGSWGTTVALAYAQAYPKSMKNLILRGICTFRPSEIDWLFNKNCGSAMKLTDSWKNFSTAVNIDSDSNDMDMDSNNNNNEIDNSQDNNDGRDVLHAYYDRLMAKTNDTNNMMLYDESENNNNNNNNVKTNGDVGVVDNNSIRLAAARSWMMWEMAASSSFKQNNNKSTDTGNNDDTSNIVLVSGPFDNDDRESSWWFENHRGEIVHDYSDDSPETIVSQIRQGIEVTTTTTTTTTAKSISGRPRSVRPIKSIPPSLVQASNDNTTTGSRFRVPQDYIPAQAMLTCYYSVNDIYVMGGPNYKNLLSKEACSSLDPDLKIIGIQGGRDPICPPDTAIDLKAQLSESKINMELRISLLSGHSMYDPAIMNEIIQATDKLANEFLVS